MSYNFGYSKDVSPVAGRALINQIQTITTQTRLNVTVCLYLRPNNRARSLSTLMAADVRSDTAGSRRKKNPSAKTIATFTFQVVNRGKRIVTYSGWEISPTKRSVTARHRNNSLLVDKWTSLYEEQSGSECCQEMRWWREKYWCLQELPCSLNKHSMRLLQSHLCCFHIQLSLPCLYICCKGTTLGLICMQRIPSKFSNCFWKQRRPL